MRAAGGALALLVAVGSWAAPVQAQRIEASVDRNQTTVGRPFEFTVRISGAANARPILPDLSAFRAQSGAVSQQVSMVNNKMSASTSYSYYLTPREPGEFEIGAVRMEVDGKTYSTEPFIVRVLGAEEAAEDRQPDAERERETFVTVTVSEDEPYVGQQVLYVWRFFRRVQVADAQLEEMSFGDLVAEPLGEVREYRTNVEGVEYLVNEIRRALFPQRPGKVVIPPSELSFQVAVRSRRRPRSVFDFGRVAMEPRSLRSRSIELDVRPLPPAPAGFDGLVGDFDIRSSLGREQVAVGESATLSVTISGRGNVAMLTVPELPQLDGFKVYEDKPSGKIERGDAGLSGSKTFRTALVPLRPGTVTLPALRLVYFDPQREQYQSKQTRALTLDVLPGEGKEDLMLTEALAPTTGKVAVRILADDILPLHRGMRALRSPGLAGWRQTLAWAGVAGPPLLYLGFLSWWRRSQRYLLDRGLRRRQAALRTAKARLRQLANDREAEHDPVVLIQLVSRCLRDYVGDKMDLEGSTLTAGEVDAVLTREGVTEPTNRRVRELFDRLEAAQYGAVGAAGLERDRLVRTLESLIESLDSELAKGRVT